MKKNVSGLLSGVLCVAGLLGANFAAAEVGMGLRAGTMGFGADFGVGLG
jgi:hypothetical protein